MLGFDQFLFFSLFLYSGIKIVSISFFSDSSSKKKNKNISDKWKNLFEAYVGVSYLIGRRYNIQKREKNEYQISMDWNGDRQKFRNFFSRFFFLHCCLSRWCCWKLWKCDVVNSHWTIRMLFSYVVSPIEPHQCSRK